jgi:hypothetical protein
MQALLVPLFGKPPSLKKGYAGFPINAVNPNAICGVLAFPLWPLALRARPVVFYPIA